MSGSMVFTIGDDRVVLEPGDEVFIPAGKTCPPLPCIAECAAGFTGTLCRWCHRGVFAV